MSPLQKPCYHKGPKRPRSFFKEVCIEIQWSLSEILCVRRALGGSRPFCRRVKNNLTYVAILWPFLR